MHMVLCCSAAAAAACRPPPAAARAPTPWGHRTRHFEKIPFKRQFQLAMLLAATSIHSLAMMRRTSNAASGGGGGGRVSKLKKRRRHTGSPTPPSLSAPASGTRQTADASTRTQPSCSSSGARLTQKTLPVHGHATNAGGVPLAEDVSPVPRRDLAASDLPLRGDGAVSRPPPVPLDQQPYHATNAKAPVNLNGKTPKRRKSNATGRQSSGPVLSSGRKSVATARTRSVGAQIKSIFGLDDQEANHQKEASSSKSANDGISKRGPYAVKNHTVRHPIMGKMAIPAIVSYPGKSSGKSDSRDNVSTAGIEFRKSLGINEDVVTFPSIDAALREKKREKSATKSHYQLGDGLRVPLLALEFPKSDPVETAGQVAAGQQVDVAKGGPTRSDSVNNHPAKQAADIAAPSNTETNPPTSTSNGLGSIQIISERGATIRNLYDLDEAEISLGRLAQHERRPYVEKKWLPEPPPEDYDDDEEGDDECVGVFRYKIILSPEDRQKLVPNGLAHYEFGWISDRGRLASDPYVICKEL